MDNRSATISPEQVSFDSELLILVDEDDNEIGNKSKAECHDGVGILHRAFSLFIFNKKGELLLQQRSADKRLWPMYWSNSCCSHPRQGESMEEAVDRRLHQELGMTSRLKYLYKFKYQAPFGELGAEHELCWVYLGYSEDAVQANDNEIAAWRYIDRDTLDVEIDQYPDRFTPWFKLEWDRLSSEFGQEVARIAKNS